LTARRPRCWMSDPDPVSSRQADAAPLPHRVDPPGDPAARRAGLRHGAPHAPGTPQPPTACRRPEGRSDRASRPGPPGPRHGPPAARHGPSGARHGPSGARHGPSGARHGPRGSLARGTEPRAADTKPEARRAKSGTGPGTGPPRAGLVPDTLWRMGGRDHGLTKRFGTNVAVDDVELLVPRRSAFGYLGPNGAGKTTLIRTLLGLTRADGGTMSLLGIPVPAERSKALALWLCRWTAPNPPGRAAHRRGANRRGHDPDRSRVGRSSGPGG
jgi:hypothetical protein